MTSSLRYSFLMAPLALATITACATDGAEVESSTTGDDVAARWEAFRANPPVTWEVFRATAEREADAPHRFIVDGDLALSSEAELRAHYDAWLEQEFDASLGGSALTVLTALGADVIWPAAQRNNLTYCVSNGFGSRKAAMVTAMGQATKSWSDRIGVTFRYVPAQDASCTSSNPNVLFNVGLSSTGSFFGVSFFPNDTRSNRQLLVTSAAFTTTSGGRDLQGILRHETGHILGFRHEHIHISCTGEGPADSRQLTSYDVNSIMHYPQCRPSGTGGYRQTALDFSGAASLYGAR